MRRLVFGFSSVLLLASAAHAQDRCPQLAEDLGKRLAPLAAQKSAEPDYPDDVSKLVEGDGDRVAPGPMIRVRRGTMTVDGNPVRTAADVAARLGTARANHAKRIQTPPSGVVLLAVEADGSWGDVEAAIRGAREAKYTAVQVLYTKRRATKIAPPKPSRITPELEKLRHADASQKAPLLSRTTSYLDDAARECPSLQQLYTTTSQVAPAERDTTFVAQLPKALVDCHCKVPGDWFDSALFEMLRPNDLERAIVQTTIALGPSASAPKLSLPRATTWSVAGKQLLDAARRAPNHAVLLAAE